MSSTALAAALFALVASAAGAAVTTDAAASLASQYSLATSTSFAFPTATLAPNDTQDLVQKQWSLAYNAVEQGGADLAFVPDPFPSAPSYSSSSNTSAPVLQVTYPAHSYSHQTGGAQFVNLWDAGANGRLQSAVLTYELAFDPGFDWVMGGKLPGIRYLSFHLCSIVVTEYGCRGGPEIDNCSGGRPSNGSNCWSARVMWRTNGAGESTSPRLCIVWLYADTAAVYSYTPTPNAFCSQPGVDCNDDDYGTSIQRGKVSFVAGQWQKLTLFVQLNEANTANGYMAL
jgi:hypothetical protein